MRMAVVALGCLVLGACAVGGGLGPGADEPGSAPPRHEGPVIEGAAGPLPLSVWAPEGTPRAVILAVHGFGDYAPSTYERAARHWAGRGILTYAYDQRGFGRGETRALWPGAEALVADLVAVAREVRRRHPCTPLLVTGHSMGGGVVMAAGARGLDADALVLAAPAIWGGAALNPIHRVAAWTAAAVVPDRRFTGEGVVEIQASDNIEALRALAADPLYLGTPSAREILGLVRVADMAASGAEALRIPSLLLLGAKDEIVPEARVREVYARVPGEKAVLRYPEGWHLLFRDRAAGLVWEDVAEYALAQDPGGGYCTVAAR